MFVRENNPFTEPSPRDVNFYYHVPGGFLLKGPKRSATDLGCTVFIYISSLTALLLHIHSQLPR